MKERFDALYEEMKMGKDVQKMRVFGTGFEKLFTKVASVHPDLAMATLDFLTAVEFHNYVTMTEAQEIASGFINDDKMIVGVASRGAHWKPEDLKSFLMARNLPLEEKPHYNWWALWLTVNMIYSDYADAIAELIGSKENEKVAVACYKLALKKLNDADRPAFIREYFHLD